MITDRDSPPVTSPNPDPRLTAEPSPLYSHAPDCGVPMTGMADQRSQPSATLLCTIGLACQRAHQWAHRGQRLSKHQIYKLLDREGDYANLDDQDSDTTDEDTGLAVKAQNFDTMLSFALKSLIELQESGFVWDTAAYGNLFKGLEFVPFVLNVKCDTEEGDLLYGKYLV